MNRIAQFKQILHINFSGDAWQNKKIKQIVENRGKKRKKKMRRLESL